MRNELQMLLIHSIMASYISSTLALKTLPNSHFAETVFSTTKTVIDAVTGSFHGQGNKKPPITYFSERRFLMAAFRAQMSLEDCCFCKRKAIRSRWIAVKRMSPAKTHVIPASSV